MSLSLATLLDWTDTGRNWTNGETERESNPDSCMADLKQDLESHLVDVPRLDLPPAHVLPPFLPILRQVD